MKLGSQLETLDEFPDDLVVSKFRIPKESKGKESGEAGSDADSSSDSGELVAAEGVASSEADASAEQDAGEKTAESSRLQPLLADLHEAWTAIDEAEQSPPENVGYSPIVYAPHLWRQLKRLLVRYEREAFFPSDPELPNRIKADAAAIKLLASTALQGQLPASPPNATKTVNNIFAAARSINPPPVDARLANAFKMLADVSRIRFKARDYVAWHGHMMQVSTASIDSRTTEEIQSLLNDLLLYDKQLASRIGRPWRPDQALRELSERIVRRERNLAGSVRSLVADMESPQSRRFADALLKTALPAATERKQLLDRLLKAETKPGEDVRLHESAPKRLSQSVAVSDFREPMLKQLQLEQSLVRLSAGNIRELDELASSIESSSDDNEIWGLLQEAGKHLAVHYSNLPQRVNNETKALQRQQLAMLADGRDASQINGNSEFPFGILPPEVAESVTLQPDTEVVSLQAEGSAAKFKVLLSSNSKRQRRARVTIDFPFDELEVLLDGRRIEDATAETLRKDGRYFPLRQQPTELLFAVSRRENANNDELHLTLNASIETKNGSLARDSKKINFAVQSPNEIDLIVVEHPAFDKRELTPIYPDVNEVRPYPNRVTDFGLRLANRSSEAKQVTVRLFRAPPNLVEVPGRLIDRNTDRHRRGQPLPKVAQYFARQIRSRPIAVVAAPVSLEPNSEVDVQLAAPKSAAGSEGAPPAKASPSDVTSGLVCVIEDGNDRWLEWIEIVPRSPDEYVDIRGSYRDSRLEVEFQPRPDQLPDDFSTESPIGIDWSNAQEVRQKFEARTIAPVTALLPGDEETRVTATIPPTNVGGLLEIEVDGFPRAFLQSVDFRSARFQEQELLQRIKLDSISMSGLVYARNSGTRPKLKEGEKPPVYRSLSSNQPIVFPAKNSNATMVVNFQADVPKNRFRAGDQGDEIKLHFSNRTHRFRTPRQRKIELQPLGEGGMLSLSSVISDFQVAIDVRGREGSSDLVGELQLDGEVSRSFSQPIIFDNDTPRNIVITAPSKITIGQPLRISRVTAIDKTAYRVDVAVLKEATKPFPPEAIASRRLRSAGRDRWEATGISLTNAKIDAPGDYFLIAKVTDQAGKSETSAPTRVRVLKKSDPILNGGGEVAPLGKGTIKGVVVFASNGNGIGEFKVTVKDNDEIKSATSGGSGKFQLNNVPPGEHTLEATRFFQGKNRKGERTIKIEKAEDFQKTWKIEIE